MIFLPTHRRAMMSALSSDDPPTTTSADRNIRRPKHPLTETSTDHNIPTVQAAGTDTPCGHSHLEAEAERAVDELALPRRDVVASSSAPAARPEGRTAQAHREADRSCPAQPRTAPPTSHDLYAGRPTACGADTRRCAAAPRTVQGPTPQLIRINGRCQGCARYSYHLEYVDKPGKFNEVVEQDGVKVLIDSKARFSIIGSEMDWYVNALSAKFVVKNPNNKVRRVVQRRLVSPAC
ncbi:uncharacterized protein B0H18DRAFT_100609 [Fomitopsis serialis]|uniref:uncharacterized protein n=1 Tax=Fomitopsis serialis TaxID=139415 RepID=UPI002008AA83|nr:uncharacterized protein B0H18DRAFT_100609 [Neoantrodia serialis]KAH9931229.1 hypothetical protein B0H18DRAFT_100609 [Neoantrodia serialis]